MLRELPEQRQGGLKTWAALGKQWSRVNVILRLPGPGSLGFTYKDRLIVYLPPEQVKDESLQSLCLDLLRPNGLEQLGGFKAVLRAAVGKHEGQTIFLVHPPTLS